MRFNKDSEPWATLDSWFEFKVIGCHSLCKRNPKFKTQNQTIYLFLSVDEFSSIFHPFYIGDIFYGQTLSNFLYESIFLQSYCGIFWKTVFMHRQSRVVVCSRFAPAEVVDTYTYWWHTKVVNIVWVFLSHCPNCSGGLTWHPSFSYSILQKMTSSSQSLLPILTND